MDALVGLIEIEADALPADHLADDDTTFDSLLARLAGREVTTAAAPAGRRNRVQQALLESTEIVADLHHLAADLDAHTTLLVARIAAAKARTAS